MVYLFVFVALTGYVLYKWVQKGNKEIDSVFKNVSIETMRSKIETLEMLITHFKEILESGVLLPKEIEIYKTQLKCTEKLVSKLKKIIK